jgi:hypothetical protein
MSTVTQEKRSGILRGILIVGIDEDVRIASIVSSGDIVIDFLAGNFPVDRALAHAECNTLATWWGRFPPSELTSYLDGNF